MKSNLFIIFKMVILTLSVCYCVNVIQVQEHWFMEYCKDIHCTVLLAVYSFKKLDVSSHFIPSSLNSFIDTFCFLVV